MQGESGHLAKTKNKKPHVVEPFWLSSAIDGVGGVGGGRQKVGKEGGGFLVAAGEGEACLVSSTQLDPANG